MQVSVKINFERGPGNGKKQQPKKEEPYKTKKKASQHRLAKVLYFGLRLRNLYKNIEAFI